MMFSKITVIASLLFFLFGTNVFAYSHQEESTPINGTVHSESFHDMTPLIVATATNNKVNKAVEPSFKDYIFPVSVGLLFIIGFGSYWLIYRRKHT